MTSELPTGIDASYPDRSPGDKAHQQHHDVVHALNNAFHNAPDGTLFVKENGQISTVGTDVYATPEYVDSATSPPGDPGDTFLRERTEEGWDWTAFDSGAYQGLRMVDAADLDGVDPTGAADSTSALNAWLADPPAGVDGLWFSPGLYIASLSVSTAGLVVAGSRRATIKVPDNANQDDNDAGIRVIADDVVVDGLTIDGNATNNPTLAGDTDLARHGDGVAVYGDRVTVQNCHIFDPIGHGIIVWGDDGGSAGAAGTTPGNRSDVKIVGNTVEGAGFRAGIDVAYNESTTEDLRILISHNTMPSHNIVLHTASHVVINGNSLAGISAHSGSHHVAISGNLIQPDSVAQITDCESVSISGNVGGKWRSNTSDHVTIVGNEVEDLLINGGTNVVVSGCSIHSVGGRLRVESGAAEVLVTGNSIYDVGDVDGIRLRDISKVTVLGNKITNVVRQGVLVAGTGAPVSDFVVADNTIDGCERGVLIAATASNGRVHGNTVRNFGTAAVANSGTNVDLHHNTDTADSSYVTHADVVGDLPAASFGPVTGTPTQGTWNARFFTWNLPAGSVSAVGSAFRVPPSWPQVKVVASLVNQSTNSGGVRVRLRRGTAGDGENASTVGLVDSAVTYTASAQHLRQDVVITTVPRPASGDLWLQFGRITHADDTLDGAVGLIRLTLERA